METKLLTFYECENWQDVYNIINDFPKGTKVLSKELHYDEEIAEIHISVIDFNEFISEFKKTESFEFLNNIIL